MPPFNLMRIPPSEYMYAVAKLIPSLEFVVGSKINKTCSSAALVFDPNYGESARINAEIFEGIQDVQDRKSDSIAILKYPNYYKVSRGGEDVSCDTEFSWETGDSIALWKVYYALKEDCLGFIERPKNFVEIGRLDGLLANAPFYQDKFFVACMLMLGKG